MSTLLKIIFLYKVLCLKKKSILTKQLGSKIGRLSAKYNVSRKIIAIINNKHTNFFAIKNPSNINQSNPSSVWLLKKYLKFLKYYFFKFQLLEVIEKLVQMSQTQFFNYLFISAILRVNAVFWYLFDLSCEDSLLVIFIVKNFINYKKTQINYKSHSFIINTH